MKFEELSKNFYEIPRELMNDCYIYFLLKDDEVVYVGQTTNGMYRPFSHKDKDFNRVIATPCERRFLDKFEKEYILKYSPKYNKNVPYASHNTLNSFRDDVITFTHYRPTVTKIYSVLVSNGITPHEFNGENYLLADEWMPALEAMFDYLGISNKHNNK